MQRLTTLLWELQALKLRPRHKFSHFFQGAAAAGLSPDAVLYESDPIGKYVNTA